MDVARAGPFRPQAQACPGGRWSFPEAAMATQSRVGPGYASTIDHYPSDLVTRDVIGHRAQFSATALDGQRRGPGGEVKLACAARALTDAMSVGRRRQCRLSGCSFENGSRELNDGPAMSRIGPRAQVARHELAEEHCPGRPAWRRRHRLAGSTSRRPESRDPRAARREAASPTAASPVLFPAAEPPGRVGRARPSPR